MISSVDVSSRYAADTYEYNVVSRWYGQLFGDDYSATG